MGAGRKRKVGENTPTAGSSKVDDFFKAAGKRARSSAADATTIAGSVDVDKALATARRLKLPTEPADLWSPSKTPAPASGGSLLERIQLERKQRAEAAIMSPDRRAAHTRTLTRSPAKKARAPLPQRVSATQTKLNVVTRTARTASALFTQLDNSVLERSFTEKEPTVAKRLSFDDLPASKNTSYDIANSLVQNETSSDVHWRNVVDSSQMFSTTSDAGNHSSITFDKSQLPKHHWDLIEIMDGLESAYGILRGRKEATCLSRMRQMVERSSSRSFRVEQFEQLLWALPGAFEILPPRGGDKSNVEIFLLDTRESVGPNPSKSPSKPRQTGSAVLWRRQQLHRRLRAHVSDCHDTFLSKIGAIPEQSPGRALVWHPEFDITTVPAIPRKPLVAPEARDLTENRDVLRTPVKQKVALSFLEERPGTPPPGLTPVGDGFIPEGLLRRVRKREAFKCERERSGETQREEELLLLSKLPGTMDVVHSVFTHERRSAMESQELIGKVSLQHPRRWGRSELEQQLSAICRTVPDWLSSKHSAIQSLSPEKEGRHPRTIYRIHPKKMSYCLARQRVVRARDSVIGE